MLGDERGESIDVPWVANRRNERPAVGVVESRRERVEVGGDGGRARAREGAHDVHALSRAREEDGRHDARA